MATNKSLPERSTGKRTVGRRSLLFRFLRLQNGSSDKTRTPKQERGARPPRAQFSAPSRKTVGHTKDFPVQDTFQIAQSAERGARSVTPGAGVLPQTSELRLDFSSPTGSWRFLHPPGHKQLG